MKKVQENVRQLMKAGKPQRQAIASALSMARKKRMAAGGEVGEPDPIESGDENKYMSDEPSAAAQEPSFSDESPDNASYSVAENMMDGNYNPNEVAGPKSLARALEEHFAEGGEVNKPEPSPSPTQSEIAQQSMRKAFHFSEGGAVPEPKENGGTEEPLSDLQRKAIEERKKKRRYVQNS